MLSTTYAGLAGPLCLFWKRFESHVGMSMNHLNLGKMMPIPSNGHLEKVVIRRHYCRYVKSSDKKYFLSLFCWILRE